MGHGVVPTPLRYDAEAVGVDDLATVASNGGASMDTDAVDAKVEGAVTSPSWAKSQAEGTAGTPRRRGDGRQSWRRAPARSLSEERSVPFSGDGWRRRAKLQ